MLNIMFQTHLNTAYINMCIYFQEVKIIEKMKALDILLNMHAQLQYFMHKYPRILIL